MNNFFEHENQPFPPSLSGMGQQRYGTKSDLLECIEQCVPSSKGTTDVDAKVLDGAVIIHMLRPIGCRFFADYAQNIFKPFIISSLDKVKRLDAIWDRYLANSLKQSTQEKRMHSGTA